MLREAALKTTARRDKATTGQRRRARAGERWREGPGLPYLPGLDGLRAIAVVAVLLYHAGLAWIPGGFLGVDVFFVLSGYLITALLLAEWHWRGRIDLKRFWIRRARRLLPALYLVLAVTLTYAVLFLPGEVAGLRKDALAAFGYVTNWYLIYVNESYFEAIGRPSLLKHLWSLAVEEQFYLLWPLAFVGTIVAWRRRLVFAAAVGGAALSALLMGILYAPNVDPSRIYYGTDTRAAALLVGAALAFLWAPWRRSGRRRPIYSDCLMRYYRRRWGWISPVFFDLCGLISLGVLFWCFLSVGEFDPFLYRGGFAMVALATAALIAAVVHPYGHLNTRLLGAGLLRWVGQRSYGIYLWHWPVFMVTRPHLDIPLDGPSLLVLRLAVTLALADLSYRYVETPVRRGALERAWRSLREAQGTRRRRLIGRWAGATAAGLMFVAVLGAAVLSARAPERPDYLAATAMHATTPAGEAAAGANPDRAERVQGEGLAEGPRSGEVRGEDPVQPGPVSAVGDSVMLSVASTGRLEESIPGLATVDARVGLQVSDAIAALEARRDAGQLGNVVIVHVGSNGPLAEEEFDEIMDVLADARKVVFVTVSVPRAWEQSNNEVIADGVRRYPKRAELADWRSLSSRHPEYFWEDGVHLRPEGQEAYLDLISREIRDG